MEVLGTAEVIEELGLAYFRELSTFGAMSDDLIVEMMGKGTIRRFRRGEYIARYGEIANEFQVVLQGRMAFYKHSDVCDVLCRYFSAGEQMGFDLMIGVIQHNGTDVATEDSVILDIDSDLFYELLVDFPEEFGLLMINLTRELSREISLLEDVIGDTTSWSVEMETDGNA